MTASPAVSTRGLVKVYHPGRRNEVRALDGLDLDVDRGAVFGLLGRNGAGKTTLLRILTTLARPTAGTVHLFGTDVVRHPFEARKKLCVVLQEYSTDVYLNVHDNLDTFARFHAIPRVDARQRIADALERFGLGEYRNQKVIDLSGGVKRRVQVAKAFMIETPLVFLDEPTTGMDPITKRATLDAIRAQAAQGRTIFLTTHILQEAEELCTSIALIDHGHIVAQGDLAAITHLVSDQVNARLSFRSLTEDALQALRALPVSGLEVHGDSVEFTFPGNRYDLLTGIGDIARRFPLNGVEISGASLEDAYVEILGTPGRSA